MNLTFIKSDLIQWTANYFALILAVVFIKTICIIEILYYWRNLETLLVILTILKYLYILYLVNIQIQI